jgi:signal transduction histidine kinase
VHQGLRFPDSIVSVDGEALAAVPRGQYRARVLDRAVQRAAAQGRPSVHVAVQSAGGLRELDLSVGRLGSFAWWTYAAVMFFVGALYAVAGLIAMWVSPKSPLARAFIKLSCVAALYFFTFFDLHTTRVLAPLWYLAYPMVPMALLVLPLRLPDDARLLVRWPWLPRVADGVGVSLGAAFQLQHLLGGTTARLEIICTQLLASSLLFFAATLFVRLLRSKGSRREILRALVLTLALPHALLAGLLLFSGPLKTVVDRIAFPMLALTPLATMVAFVRHDIWASRVLLSRFLTRAVIAGIVCAVAIAAGTGLASGLGVPFSGALIAAAAGAIVAAALVTIALRAGDRTFFPSLAQYKPTVEQLSDELTSIASPHDVAHAVERTVRRWLPCDHIQFEFEPSHEKSDAAPILLHESGAHQIQLRASGSLDADELTLPVMFQGVRLGTLGVGKKRGGALFTSEDLDLLRTIANQGALAIAHANAYAELEKRRRQQAAAWRDEREALVETLSAEIAHEVRYPINFFRSIFKRASQSRMLDFEDIEIGCEEVDRLERLVSGLRRMATHHIERNTVQISELCARAEVLLRDRTGERGIEIDLGRGGAIRCDIDKVTQILVNLLANALDAAEPKGRVGLTWRTGPSVGEIVVWDTGPGFAGESSRLFAPWFTTKPRGTGLGLAITYRLVRAHGWNVEAQRREGRTLFVVTVPPQDIVELRQEPASGTREIDGETAPPQRRGTVA